MSETLDDFGTLSHNLLNKTSCTYVKTQMDTIFGAYCPTINSIAFLFFDTCIWIYIAVGFSIFQMVFFYLIDVSTRKAYILKVALFLHDKVDAISDLKSTSKKL